MLSKPLVLLNIKREIQLCSFTVYVLKLIMIKLPHIILLLVSVILSEAEIAATLTEGDVRLVRQLNAPEGIGRLDIYLKGNGALLWHN